MKKNEFNKKLGLCLYRIRLKKKLTQLDVSALLGNNPQNISRIERGEISPTLFWVFHFAKCLDVNPQDILKEFDECN
jgi:transcriptional regulator with XRE-family HTH domain